MPYRLVGNCVYKGEEKLKCYNTHQEAVAYFRALKMNVHNSIIHKIPLYISKSSLFNGEMRWSAVNSDTDWDLYGERMSLELYKSMISKIKSNIPPPPPFAELVSSNYWKGGMPYLSIAHYSDGNGKSVPGKVKELFIDGNQLKARGMLHNSPLGLAVWKSLKEDEINYKNVLDIDRIRISIAFLDLAHKHGEDGKVFYRKSFSDMCQECLKGIGEKIYLDGYLVHLALTRVPVNPRTIMEAEDVMAKKSKPTTRKEDALSVVQDETLVDEVENASLEMKSGIADVLVEMSETEVLSGAKDEGENSDSPAEILSVSKSELAQLIQDAVHQYYEEDEEEKRKQMEEKKMEEKSDSVSESPILESDMLATQTEKSALELSVDKLYNAVSGAINKAGTAEEKLQEVQPALEKVGQAIVSVVRSSVGDTAPILTAQADQVILEALQNLTSRVEAIGIEVATLKAQPVAPPTNRIPTPRSISPTAIRSDIVPANQENPNSVKSIVRRSVGLQ